MSITIIIIAITVAASFIAWSRTDLYEKWLMIPYRIKHDKEFYRFITSGFIHSGYVHLAFNMLSFYFFGRILEVYLGAVPFVALYILGIIVSDIPTYLKYHNHSYYRSLGASGGVSAIIFSFILFDPLAPLRLFFIPITAFIFAILYLIYSYYQAKNASDNINHDAHFYGAVFGLLFTAAIHPPLVTHFFSEISNWSLFQN